MNSFYYKKAVDKSLLFQGFTIPRACVNSLFESIGFSLQKGDSAGITITVNGVSYRDAVLYYYTLNRNRDIPGEMLLVHYKEHSEISKDLRQIFVATASRVDEFLATRTRRKTSAKLSDEEKEYVEITVEDGRMIFNCLPLSNADIHFDFIKTDELKSKALSGGSAPLTRHTVPSGVYYRNPFVSEYVKRIADGVCELCGKAAPFTDEEGHPYLEAHRIVWISEGGEDSVKNTVALCPSCHRKMHVVNDISDIELLKSKAEKH